MSSLLEYSGGQAGDGRPLAAQGTGGIFLESQNSVIKMKRIVQEEAASQRVSNAEYQLHDFCGLDQADLSRDRAQDAYLASGRDEAVPWRVGPYTAQARASGSGMKDTSLALEARGSSEYIRLSREEAGIIHQVFGGEIVRPIKDDVKTLQYSENVTGGDPLIDADKVDFRIGPPERFQSRFYL